MILLNFTNIWIDDEMLMILWQWQGLSSGMISKSRLGSAKLWLLDSGASFHMMRVDDVADNEIRLRTSRRPACVQTANGVKTLDSEVVSYLPILNKEITCFVFADTANVVSTGQLIENMV